jgi:hypothetical protein
MELDRLGPMLRRALPNLQLPPTLDPREGRFGSIPKRFALREAPLRCARDWRANKRAYPQLAHVWKKEHEAVKQDFRKGEQ